MLPFLSDSFGVKTTNTSIHPRSSRKPYPIPDKNGQTLHPFKTEAGQKLKSCTHCWPQTLVAARLWERERKRLERHDVPLMRNCYIFYHFMRKNVRIMLYFVASVFVILIYFFCGF